MSYCRWSSDNFRCDLYCYYSIDGTYVIDVSTGRPRYDPEIPNIPIAALVRNPLELIQYHQHLDSVHKDMPKANLALPHDGETFEETTLEAFKDRLLYLRGLGYSFPEYVLEIVNQEIKHRQ